MRSAISHVLAFAVAMVACWGVALWALDRVERKALTDIGLILSQSGHDWVEIDVDGLIVTMSGTGPDEATRFAALTAVGRVVDTTRIVDEMEVAASDPIAPPQFSLEILKNDDGLSLIGLVPGSTDRDELVSRVRRGSGDARVLDLIETADFPAPRGWGRALDFAISTLDELPRSKISVTAGSVTVVTVAQDPQDKRRIDKLLSERAPAGLALDLRVSAPRQVIAPFTLRLISDADGVRFDACSAAGENGRDAILAAAIRAGLTGGVDCALGLGAPSPDWSAAAVAGIGALETLGGGTLTMSNTEMAVTAPEGTEKRAFDRAIGDLEARLPDAFSLTAVLPELPEAETLAEPDAPEFLATRSPEGLVQLRGRLSDELSRAAIETFARARFAGDEIYPATLSDPSMPAGWPGRVLSGIEALSLLHNGFALVTEDMVEVTGVSGRKDARSEIARVLSANLPEGADFKIEVTYSEEFDPQADLPTPAECIERIGTAAATRKITFAPSSADIEADALPTIDAIAEVLRKCQSVPIEIAGFTDSQGRETMNQALSQARADAVLNAIMSRRVLVSNLTAIGYGEEQPVASNESEEGREANRRIEFRLRLPGVGAVDGVDYLLAGEDEAPAETATDDALEDETTGEAPMDEATGDATDEETPE